MERSELAEQQQMLEKLMEWLQKVGGGRTAGLGAKLPLWVVAGSCALHALIASCLLPPCAQVAEEFNVAVLITNQVLPVRAAGWCCRS